MGGRGRQGGKEKESRGQGGRAYELDALIMVLNRKQGPGCI